MTFSLGNRLLEIGLPPFLIAEIGVNFNGDLEIAKQTIDAAVSVGADAVKFQSFRAEEFIADRKLTYSYKVNGIEISEHAYEMFKRLELSMEWHRELKDYADQAGVMFLSSAADSRSADLLADLGVYAIKIASEDLINIRLLRHIAGLNLPVLLSTGMADQWEIDQAIEVLANCPSLLLMHCTSLYPTPLAEINLKRMQTLANRYCLPVGFSDHSMGVEAAVGATAMGALVIEKHFTLSRSLPGPDHAMSADPQEFSNLIASVRRMSIMMGNGVLEASPGELISRMDFRRSIVAARNISAGTVLSQDDLMLKRPHNGIHPFMLDKVVGKIATEAFEADQPISWINLA